jgi:Tol biopolymer transport system component
VTDDAGEDAPAHADDASGSDVDASDAAAPPDAAPFDAGFDAGFDATLPFAIFLESPTVGNAAANGSSYFQNALSAPDISQTGQYLAFLSTATNLQGGSGATTSAYRYFTRDTVANVTTQVSLRPDGGDLDWPYNNAVTAISGDGRYIVYQVLASDWDPTLPTGTAVLLRWDRTTGKSTLVGETADGGTLYGAGSPVLSADGRYLAFTAGTLEPVAASGGTTQVWVRDFSAPGDGLTLASVTNGPLDAGPDAGDAAVGVPVGSTSFATSITSVSMSSDGTVIAFDAQATNLESGLPEAGASVDQSARHCYVRNMTTQTTQRVDVQMPGATVPFPDSECDDPLVSGNGRYVLFFSDSSNLVPNDTNGTGDVFVRDLQLGTTTRITTTSTGAQIASIAVLYPDYGISNDGSLIVVGDRSHLMVAGDTSNDNRVLVLIDTVHQTRKIASFNPDGQPFYSPQDTWTPALSYDGTSIAFLVSGSQVFATNPTGQDQIAFVKTSSARVP